MYSLLVVLFLVIFEKEGTFLPKMEINFMKFFIKTKNKIIELAKNAVLVAESELGSGKGQEKKKLAINYVLKNLPVSSLIKSVISILLSSFIDDAIEVAVEYMKTLPKLQGE